MPKDPVCGMDVTEQTGHQYEHENTTYYFCSQNCEEAFVLNPEKYIDLLQESSQEFREVSASGQVIIRPVRTPMLSS